LQAAIYAIGIGHINGYGIKLAQGSIVAFDPGFAIVVGDIDAAVVAEHEMARPSGVNPKGVVVAMYIIAVDTLPVLAAIVAAQHGDAEDVYALGVGGRYAHLAEVVAVAVVDVVEITFVGFTPALAAVFAAVYLQTYDLRIE
jgi:hypothetical protein